MHGVGVVVAARALRLRLGMLLCAGGAYSLLHSPSGLCTRGFSALGSATSPCSRTTAKGKLGTRLCLGAASATSGPSCALARAPRGRNSNEVALDTVETNIGGGGGVGGREREGAGGEGEGGGGGNGEGGEFPSMLLYIISSLQFVMFLLFWFYSMRCLFAFLLLFVWPYAMFVCIAFCVGPIMLP